jgi:hypothetical protein
MINGAHVIVFSHDPEADRRFLREVLATRSVDAGDGWLILALPPAEIAVHPTDNQPRQELYLACDDITATLDACRTYGATVVREPADARWGVAATIALPSGARLSVYEPRHLVAYEAR